VAAINSKVSFFLILFSLLSFTACEEQVEKGDELSDSAREFLRRRAALKCINGSNGTVEEFYENSNEKLMDYERADSWEFKYSKGTTEVDTSHIYVWKVTSTHVYFRLRLEEGGTTTNYFLKMDTTTNMDMIRNLQRDKCNKDLTLNFSSSKMTANIESPRINEDADTESESEVDYRIESQYPAFFGALNRKKTKRFYDKDDDDTVKKTETYDYVFKRISDVTQPATFTDSTISNRRYCVVPSVVDPDGSSLRKYAFPFVLNNCVTSDTVGPDADGDTVPDFDPSAELPL
jgi:hypothetical protein